MQKLIATALVFVFVFITDTFAQGSAFTYQGRLNANGTNANGNYDLRFILYNADVGGSQIGPILTNSAVAVNNGLFTTALNFGAGNFPGGPRFLEIAVRSAGSGPGFDTLNPRQPVTPTPYAITAGNVSAGIHSNAVTFNNAANSFSGNGAGLTALNASQLIGAVPSSALSNAWKTTGNAGTIPGTHFVGTIDNQPLELRVKNEPALRLEPGYVSFFIGTNSAIFSNAPNVIGGTSLNRVGPGVFGAVIGGGLGAAFLNNTFAGFANNQVLAYLGTICGGSGNTIETNAYSTFIGGGSGNSVHADAKAATIAGGQGNTIETNAFNSTISGGTGNRIRYNANHSTISGGYGNTIFPAAIQATVGGGFGNVAGGHYSTVPGGINNIVTGSYGFVAGRRAQSGQDGCFVWADSQDADFFSTAANQFLIRASGGVGIGTSSPHHQLRISGGPSWTSEFWQGAIELDNAAAIGWNANAAGNRFGIGQSSGGLYIFATGSDPGNTANPANRILIINNDANVGIQKASPVYDLELGFDSAGKPNGGSWANSSDARIKKNIQPLSGALDKLTQLRGVSFEWINPADHANQTGRQSGFIAQEVEQVFPNWVQEVPGATRDAVLTPDGKIKSLSLPFEFDALTVEALRELRAENAELKKSVAELKELVSKLAAQRDGGER